MTETIDKVEQREQWIGLLNAAWMFHQQLVKDTTSEIKKEEPDSPNMIFKDWSKDSEIQHISD